MKTGTVAVSVIPGRKEPNEKSEMTTQLLFGEEYHVLEEKDKWLKIRGTFDKYECWIDKKMHHEHPLNSIEVISVCIGDFIKDNDSGEKIRLSPGSIIRKDFPTYNEAEDLEITLQKFKSNDIEYVCTQFLGTPYLWGGKTFMGIDCSGFTQVVYRAMGFMIPRDAWQQEEIGEKISFENLQKGDLAFFSSFNADDPKKITHVGIVLDGNQIIHAAGRVRRDRYDQEGIFNVDTKAYSHRLISSVRVN